MEGGRKILVVEDDPVLKIMLGHELAEKYSLTYAKDGEEALAAFEDAKPELVLLDLMIPKINGFDVLEKIRTGTDERKDTPIIVLSNLDQQADRDRAMAAGANAYLVKANVAIEEIATAISKNLPA